MTLKKNNTIQFQNMKANFTFYFHPLLAGPQEVPAHETRRDHHTEIRPRIPGPLVRPTHSNLCYYHVNLTHSALGQRKKTAARLNLLPEDNSYY